MTQIYKASNYPIFQNRVYNTRQEAMSCQKGDLNIVMDEEGFVSNIDFDQQKMIYDNDYDNSVPSDFFKEYYNRLGRYLIKKYNLDEKSIILDIGCGKGTFLKQMYEELEYSGLGFGIDPSYEGNTSLYQGKLNFICEYFKDEHLDQINNVSLVLLRHTLEHIPNPTLFLSLLFEVFRKRCLQNVPIFIEVPDVDWIMHNKSYWDFFYEHVNYFSKYSLHNCIRDAKGIVMKIINEFGDQYIWCEALINSNAIKMVEVQYKTKTTDFNHEIMNNSEKIKNTIPNNYSLVIWGMASKGIIFSMQLFDQGIIPNYFVDVNKNKQNKFIPSIGVQISSPDHLPKNESLFIICMNPNYAKEIYESCEKLKLNFNLFSPNLESIKY